MKNYYMHTLDGEPGFFDGEQICFYDPFLNDQQVCSSLRQIRREQRESRKFRIALFGEDNCKYGHVRFRLPTERGGE